MHSVLCTEKPKPTVSVDQSSIYTGDRVTLSCHLEGPGWTFLFYENQKISPLSKEAADANTHEVTVSNVRQTTYYCKARRGNYESEFSDPATITVRARPQPVVTVHPAESVFTGESVTLTCEIQTGGSWQYHWYRDNNKLSAEIRKTYTITDVKESNKGGYTCKGTQSSDPKYTETSAAVTLTVSEKPKPELTSSLKGDVLTGNSVTLTCTLTPQSNGWKFYWTTLTQSNETKTETFNFTIRSVSVSDGGQYRCRAGRGNPVYYTHYSKEFSLKVKEIKPVVIINPDRQVFRGETVTFRCNRTGGATKWTYSWYKNDNTQLRDTTQELIIRSVGDSDGGKYTCRGTRKSDSQLSQISPPVTLSVSEKPKAVITSSRTGAVLLGNSVTLTCTLDTQSTGWKFYWIKDGRNLETVTNSNKITISSVGESNRGGYQCRAGRGDPVYYTHYSNELQLNVTEKPKPVITSSPEGDVLTGTSVTLTCTLNVQSDGWKIYWTTSRQSKETKTAAQYYYSSYYSYYYSHHYIRSVSVSDGGQYKCRAGRGDPVYYTHYSNELQLDVTGE
ncbi:cell adhesion molecule CEACAM5-like [Clarias gariepinus]